MAVRVEIAYEGSLRCGAVHGPSGTRIETDAPTDNMGKGERFSPTDLVATALGSCMLTTMAIVAERNGIPFDQARVSVEKHMTTAPPRKIAELTTVIELPASFTPEQRTKLEHAAKACPVHKSLDHDVAMPIEFRYV